MRTLVTLAKFSFQCGLIGVNELRERLKVARWLSIEKEGIADPRLPEGEDNDDHEKMDDSEEMLRASIKNGSNSPDWIEFLFDGKWCFTISDPDDYPSIPHGHLNSPNRPWPKLNPYTGRSFKAKHQENTSMRLSKSKMQTLWRDYRFRSFCRDHILWYMQENPHHVFPVADPLRFPRW